MYCLFVCLFGVVILAYVMLRCALFPDLGYLFIIVEFVSFIMSTHHILSDL